MPAAIHPKRIGYLRALPASDQKPVTSAGANKAMWKKLVVDGLALCVDGNSFVRTEQGDKVLADFDANISEQCRRVLNTVKAGESRAAAMKGMNAMIYAGLVVVLEGAPYYALSVDGLAAADPINEEGYFSKSGNRVRVLGVCADKGYEGNLEVERLDGDNEGKRMLIPRNAFVREDVWAAMVA